MANTGAYAARPLDPPTLPAPLRDKKRFSFSTSTSRSSRPRPRSASVVRSPALLATMTSRSPAWAGALQATVDAGAGALEGKGSSALDSSIVEKMDRMALQGTPKAHQEICPVSKVLRPDIPSIDKTAKLQRVGIMQLPSELLVDILLNLPDLHGFTSHLSDSTWYTPPMHIALVCRRWTPIAQKLFYTSILVHHIARILPLHLSLSRNLHLRQHVRHLSFNFLPSATKDLRQRPHGRTVSLRSGSMIKSEHTSGPIYRPYANLQLLHAILHSLPGITSLRISGVPLPAVSLFSPSSQTLPPNLMFVQDCMMRSFSNVSKITLTAATMIDLDRARRQGAAIQIEDITIILERFVNLSDLVIKGFVSASPIPRGSRSTSSAHQFGSSSPSHLGRPVKPLPARVYLACLRLRQLSLFDCSFTRIDLRLILSYISPSTLMSVTISEHHSPSSSNDPTIKLLGSILREQQQLSVATQSGCSRRSSSAASAAVDLLKGLRHLTAALYNWLELDSSSRSNGPSPLGQSSRQSLLQTPVSIDADIVGLLEQLFPFFGSLESIDLAGTVCDAQVMDHLPSTVTKVVLRACSNVPIDNVEDYLRRLTKISRRFDSSPSLSPFSSPSSSTSQPHDRLPSDRQSSGSEQLSSSLRVLGVQGARRRPSTIEPINSSGGAVLFSARARHLADLATTMHNRERCGIVDRGIRERCQKAGVVWLDLDLEGRKCFR